MSYELRGVDGSDLTYQAVKAVLRHGQSVPSRVGHSRELLDVSLTVAHPDRMLAEGINRADLRPALAVAEGLHLIAGTPHGALMKEITADIDSVRWTAEVPPPAVVLRDQMVPLLRELEASPESRRGYATLWRPGDLEARADQACAVGLHFIERQGALRLNVTMRSNDAWHGLPYNLFAFGLLHSTVAIALGSRAGAYRQTVTSLHLYEKHVKRACAVCRPEMRAGWSQPYRSPEVGGIGWPITEVDTIAAWGYARRRAADLLKGLRPDGPVTAAEEWCYRAIYEAVG